MMFTIFTFNNKYDLVMNLISDTDDNTLYFITDHNHDMILKNELSYSDYCKIIDKFSPTTNPSTNFNKLIEDVVPDKYKRVIKFKYGIK